MTDATELDEAAVRARVEAATERWTWHEATDDTFAGWGAHMGQMLYRLPRDRQTDDMRASILAMVADLSAALDEITRLRTALHLAMSSLTRALDTMYEASGVPVEHQDDTDLISETLVGLRAALDEARAEAIDSAHALEAAESALAAIRTLARSWSGRHDLLMTGDSAAHDIEAALAATTTDEGDDRG